MRCDVIGRSQHETPKLAPKPPLSARRWTLLWEPLTAGPSPASPLDPPSGKVPGMASQFSGSTAHTIHRPPLSPICFTPLLSQQREQRTNKALQRPRPIPSSVRAFRGPVGWLKQWPAGLSLVPFGFEWCLVGFVGAVLRCVCASLLLLAASGCVSARVPALSQPWKSFVSALHLDCLSTCLAGSQQYRHNRGHRLPAEH